MSRPLDEITLESLEWERLRQALRARLATPYGQAEAAALAPLPKLSAVHRSLAQVSELATLVAEAGPLELGGVEPLEPLLERAEKGGRLEGAELLAVLALLRAGMEACGRLRRAEAAPSLVWLADGFVYLNPLAETLAEALTDDGDLNERVFPELAELRQEIAERREAIHRRLDKLLAARQWAPMLQERIYSLRGSRYVVPVKADFKGQLPGIVHDVSSSGATLFVEPQVLVEETNAFVLAEKRHGAAVDAILRRLSGQVGECAELLRANAGWLGRVDLVHAQARLTIDYGGVAPEVGEGERVALRGVAHPLLLLEGSHVVRNDVALGAERRCVVVSGANTGGKTVLLKAVGLCLLLVRHGMPVPALAGSRVDWFPRVAADIGDQQTLSGSLSTFSAQIETLVAMEALPGPGTVLLIDEMLTGTEPRHGAALAAAALERFVERGALCLVTTHYGDLKALAGTRPGFANAAMAFDLERMRPTFRLQQDVPGASYAFSISTRHGLAGETVERARQRLEAEGLEADTLLEQLQGREQQLARQERESAQAREAAARLSEQLAERERQVADRENAQRRRERRQVGGELARARRQVSDLLRDLRREASAEAAERARARIGELERAALEALPEPAAADTAPFDAAAARPGDRVYLPGLERSAELVELDAAEGRARLRVGAMVFEAALGELAAPPPAGPAAQGKAARGSRRRGGGPRAPAAEQAPDGQPAVPNLVLQGTDNVLDLRGLRLDEALERTDRFFDLCVVKHVSPVLLIHGHGTGRLKSGLRERLDGSPYVDGFRPGEAREGGDGVTVVALKL